MCIMTFIIKKICIECVEDKISYDIDTLFDNINNDINMKINYIRTVIKKTNLKNFINTKQSKNLLLSDLKKIY